MQILLIILKCIFHVFMLSSPGDKYVKTLTFTLYCGGVCVGGGGGGQSRPYITFQKSTMTPLSATVYRKFVGIGG